MRHSVYSLPPSTTSLRMPYARVKSQFLPALPRPRPVNGYSITGRPLRQGQLLRLGGREKLLDVHLVGGQFDCRSKQADLA
jgi:hypothetical protein